MGSIPELEKSPEQEMAIHRWDSPGKNTGVGCHFLLQCMIPHASKVVTSSRKHISYPGKQEFQQRYGMEPLGFCFG